MVGWHHWPNGHEFEQTLGYGEGQRTLTCYSPWGSQSQTCLSNWTEVLTTGSLSMNPPSSVCTQKIQFLVSFRIPWLTSHPSAKLCWIPGEKLQSFSPHRDLPSPTKSLLYLLKTCPWESVDLELPQEQDWSEVPFPFLYFAGFHIWIHITLVEEFLGIFMQGSPGKHLTAMDLSHFPRSASDPWPFATVMQGHGILEVFSIA